MEKVMISLNVLNAIYEYLYHESSSVSFKMNGFFDKIYVNRYTIPSSFDDEKSVNSMNNNGFVNAYEFLNAIYSKIEIDPLPQEVIDEGGLYDFVHIQFFSSSPKYNSSKKDVLHNFIIFYCYENSSSEINSIRILYKHNGYFTNYIVSLLRSEYLKGGVARNEVEEAALKDLKAILVGICQHLHIDLPEIATNKNLLPEEVKASHFEELLVLISRNTIDSKMLKKMAKKMFVNYKAMKYEDDFFEQHNMLFGQNYCWDSDWKFEAEDAKYFISQIIEEDFSFTYPEKTYSDDLFPYIQSALSERDLELMNFDTMADDYIFFVANKNSVSRIVELSELLKMPVGIL